jgi:voltage-gated potassium channel
MPRQLNRVSYNLILLSAILLFLCASFLTGDGIPGTVLISFCSSVMLLAATYAIREKRKHLIIFAFGLILMKEGSRFLGDNSYLDSFVNLVNVIFFLLIVFRLVRQVARSREVNLDVILESINGYLLVGLSGSVLFALVYRIQEGAFAFVSNGMKQMSDFIYYGFITMTTIGYGDITPASGLSRLLAVIVGISGQLYIAIIIATLVGKYLARQSNNP